MLGQGGKAARAEEPEKEVMVVFCNTERDEIGIRTLVGEYREEGVNHGRKFYKKSQKIVGHEDISVFLYFWDDRDGASFSGWWFGNQVGGAQVWSRNAQAAVRPPRSGWTIPWDGDVRKELVVAPQQEQTAQQSQAKMEAQQKLETRRREEAAKSDDNLAAEWEERVEKATLKAAEVEVGVSEALEAAKEAMDQDVDDHAMQEAQKELATQATLLSETQRTIAREGIAAQKAPPPLKAEMAALANRMRQLQSSVTTELMKLKNSKQVKAQQIQEEEKRFEDEGKEREMEEGYARQLEEMLPPAMEKTDAAEDEVEKVSIAAAPLQIDTADDLRSVMMQAIKETEQRVRSAQTAIGEARRFISGKLSQVGRFAPNAKKTAVEEFTTLQERLKTIQEKLDPLKTARQDYEQRVSLKKLHEELCSKISSAEIEVEKAAMMTAPLGGESIEGVKETEAALSAAQASLSQSSRLMDSKLRVAGDKTSHPLVEEMKALKDRVKSAQGKLDEVRRTIKETQVRVAADTLLRDVSEKVSKTEDELQNMAEAELPFLRGEEKELDMDALIGEADKVAIKVHTAIAESQTFVARKLVEVARFSEGPAKAVKGEIDMLQKRLEDGRERLQQFRSAMADRKRAHLLEEVDQQVKAAEEELQRMAEATKALDSIGGAGEVTGEGGQEAVEEANVAERAAQASLVVARKSLLQKTADMKKLAITGAGAGSELGRLQTRVNHVQQEIAKLRNTIKDAEERLRVKQMMSEVTTRLETTEDEVEKVTAAVKAEEQPLAEQVERLDKAAGAADVKLSTTAKLLDVKLKSAQGFLKEELQAMRTKVTASEKKLEGAVKTITAQRDQLRCSEVLAEAGEQLRKAEAELEKLGEAELPFIKGVAVEAKEAQQAVKKCEVAGAAAHKAVTDTRTFVVQKLTEVRELSKAPAEACGKDLAAMQKRLDSAAAKLAEFKRDTAERKRTAQMQASGEKITAVEEAVKKLAASMTKFPEDKLGNLSDDEAREACEEIADMENAAKKAVSEARKFLAARALDAKGNAELTADLARLQARLTQCQVELAKLSKQCDEREQRFVAQKLVTDATKSMSQLRADVDYAGKVAQELLADDRSELLTVIYHQAAATALLAHAKASAATPEALFKGVGSGAAASQAQLKDWLLKLADLTNSDDACFTEARAEAVAARIAAVDGPGGGKIDIKAFKALLRERHACSAGTQTWSAAKGGQEKGRVEAGEGLELLEPISGDRAHCVLARDGAKVWVPADCLKVSPPFAGRLESIEAFVKVVHLRCSEAASSADQKTVELSHVKQGPLVDVKVKLQEIRTALGQERSRIDGLKKKAIAAKATVVEQRKEEVQQMQEARCKTFAAKSVNEGTAAVEAAEAKVAAVLDAKAGSAEKLQQECTVKELDGLREVAEQALRGLAEAKAVVVRGQQVHEGYKGPSRNLLLESRVELTKLGQRLSTSERKLRVSAEAVRKAHTQVVKKASLQARGVLREAVRKSGQTIDALFDKVSGKKTEISEQQFLKFVKTLPGHSLDDEKVSLVYHDFGAHGLKKPDFAKALQDFCHCDRPTPITSAADTNSTVVRNLEKAETFEILEGPTEDGEGVKRARGRAMRDGTEGWVTLRSGEEPPNLKPREKPFMWVAQPVSLLQEFDSSSPQVRDLQQDEVLELLEGPRQQKVPAELTLHAKTKDGTVGWVTLRDATGKSHASPCKNIYVCRSTIAMTDNFDIKACKVLRKVVVGETLQVIGGEDKADGEQGFSRLQFKAVKDGKEGWVTLKGNQGTTYVELSDSHFKADRALALRSGAAKDAEKLGDVKKGDVLEGQEPPKEVRPPARFGARARTLDDGKAGWVIFAGGPKAAVKPWKKNYLCKAPTELTSELALPADGAAAARKTELGAAFLVVEGPSFDPSSGLRRVRLATLEEGVVGWATLRGPDGKAFLEVA